jgi:hypothetical protein
VKRAALIALCIGCAGPEDPGAPGVQGCSRYSSALIQTGITPSRLKELSGLAASVVHPGIYWAHNDSGDAFTLYAIKEDGSIVASFPLSGAREVDLEDIAVAPCRKGNDDSCIWLGDIGDNDRSRAAYRLYRFPEPPTLQDSAIAVEVLNYTLPDGPRNSEALFVDRDATAYIISKTDDSLGEVYRLDELDRVGRATLLATLTAPGGSTTTSAALHPSTERLLLRTGSHVFEYRRAGAKSVLDLLSEPPVDLPQPSQPQSEAISYTHDGRGYLVGSENAGAALYRVNCSD